MRKEMDNANHDLRVLDLPVTSMRHEHSAPAKRSVLNRVSAEIGHPFLASIVADWRCQSTSDWQVEKWLNLM